MDPFTLALATFGVQKLRGKSTKRALRDAAIVGGGSYALGQVAPQLGVGTGQAFSGVLGSPETYGDRGLKTITGSEIGGKQFMDPERIATVARSSPLSEAVLGSGSTEAKKGLGALLDKAKENKLETELIASTVLPLLQGEGEPMKEPFTKEDYEKAYKEQAEKYK